ncbi:conserved transmembrane domain protein [Mycobacterium ulcerans str. Harvey]|uniref:Conserved transmembrane domain protein n=1 Tax=Mycobacterium ulcerans str. Harvey TaxID=1299332 RepID=A0ABP3AQT0_MYCUL|nr:conserved transmembrane domain protein [Mycobacterium ulcerans str. Harvey]
MASGAGRLADLATLAGVAAISGLIMLPQFISVEQQEDIIAGHSFLTYLSKKRGVFDAVFQHSRHLNDFPVQYALIALAAIGGFILLIKKIWWPLAVWLLLVVMNVNAGTPLGGPIDAMAGSLGEFFYNDPRRIAAATTLLLMLMAGVALFWIVTLVVAAARDSRIDSGHCPNRSGSRSPWRYCWGSAWSAPGTTFRAIGSCSATSTTR